MGAELIRGMRQVACSKAESLLCLQVPDGYLDFHAKTASSRGNVVPNGDSKYRDLQSKMKHTPKGGGRVVVTATTASVREAST